RPMTLGGPDLLPVDDIVIAVAVGPGLERREVGARAGLGITLRPVVLARADARQVLGLLLARAVVDDDGADEMRARGVVRHGAGAAELEIVDIALHRRPAGAAVLDRPMRDRPALAVERAMEFAQHVAVDDEAGGEIDGAPRVVREVVAQEAAHLVA